MNINHSAEYLALWKSHKRAEWEAVRLDQEAKAMRVAATVADAQLLGSGELNTVGVMARVSVQASQGDGITAEQLEQESNRMWGLYSTIKAELAQVEAALTADQRKNAEKVLKQWEREEQARSQ
ncbi:MAG: hypothetical protein ACE5Q6_08775 [Dehalococcoidia bacterium]